MEWGELLAMAAAKKVADVSLSTLIFFLLQLMPMMLSK